MGRRGAPLSCDGITHLASEVQLGAGEHLGAVLQHPFGLRLLCAQLLDEAHARYRQRFHLRAVHAKHHVAKHRRGGVVNMHDGAARTAQRLHGAANQLLARLGQHLDGHVIGHMIAFYQQADKIKIGL